MIDRLMTEMNLMEDEPSLIGHESEEEEDITMMVDLKKTPSQAEAAQRDGEIFDSIANLLADIKKDTEQAEKQEEGKREQMKQIFE